MKTITKDPDAIIRVGVNWGPWLGGEDTIDTPTWIAEGTATATAESNTDTWAYVLVGGGTVGQRHLITSRIDTPLGQRNDQSFWVRIVPKK